ncbi:Protein of unknown function (DUF2985) [Teratosphaeria destructans]|uniref:Uncharacterized protein n=1 Tax=Teratosphaeria destructans TaxID=418781 RepID=A0A9W7W3B5_9PEZI|nr:Protein of unknown function (DUF2985) [Teratosphaeria destructans]
MADQSPSPNGDPSPVMISSTRKRTNTIASVAQSVRSVTSPIQSVATDLLQRDPPVGFFAATAATVAYAPTVGEIRRGSYGDKGWRVEEQRQRRRPSQQTCASPVSDREVVQSPSIKAFAALHEEPDHAAGTVDGATASPREHDPPPAIQPCTDQDRIQNITKDRRVYSSGYVPPPVVPWTTSTWIGLKAFWKWFLTPLGFLVTFYGLNVVAWGGMLFLLLCNASKPMCWAPVPGSYADGERSSAASLALNDGRYPRYHNCNDINSPRRIWIEIDSQILNALFCVTGFGFIPWRFRDLYYLLRFRLTRVRRAGYERKMYGLRVLAGIYRGWFRLPGSDTLNTMSSVEYQRSLVTTGVENHLAALTNTVEHGAGDSHNSLPEDTRVPIPVTKRPDDPLTGVRAPPTATWKLDFFIWCQVGNTLFQAVLCGFMWGMTRYNRPPWATGLFIALGCAIAGIGGLVSFLEGKKVKRVEGVSPAGWKEGGGEGEKLEDGLGQVRTGEESLRISVKGN